MLAKTLFICGRLLRVLFIAGLIVVIAQDILIFPGVVRSVFTGQDSEVSLPSGVQSLFVKTEDNESLEVWRLSPDREQKVSSKAAIIFHGNGGTLADFFSLQLFFSALGISSYGFDYRGFGRSSGWPSEEGLHLDGEAVIKLVMEKEAISAKDIIVLGISVGSGPAARAASRFDVGTLVLLAPYESLKAVVEQRPGVGLLSPFLFYSFPTAEYVSRLQDTCLIIGHGAKDTIISPANSPKIVDAYDGTSRVMTIFSDEAGHNDLFFKIKPRLEQAVFDCLKDRTPK